MGEDCTSLKVAVGGAPLALVDRELPQIVITRVLVGLRNDPGRCVTDTEIEHLALCDEVVQALHDLRDGSGEVPPVNVQQVNVVCLELSQRSLNRDLERFRVLALVIDHPFWRVWSTRIRVRGGVFGRDNHLLAVLARLHPLADPFLRFLALVVVRRVDEVAACMLPINSSFRR